MTGITQVARRNVRRWLAGRNRVVVARRTGADDLGMVNRIVRHGNPWRRSRLVTGITHCAGRNM